MMTVKDLIDHFEEVVIEKERNRGASFSREPDRPLLICFLGEDSIGIFKDIASYLFDMWPAYKNEIFFLGMKDNDSSGIDYFDLQLENKEIKTNTISENEVGRKISLLFGSQSHFNNKSYLQVYYVLNTEKFNDAQLLEKWIDVMRDM